MNRKNAQFKFKRKSTLDIGEDITKLKTTKSFGNNNISSYFFKPVLPLIETSLVIMFHTSIESSQFPDLWKLARVSPIHKLAFKSDKSNYRPISILPVISRFFETLIANQFYQYINEIDMLSSNHSISLCDI